MELFKLLGTIAINGADKANADIEKTTSNASKAGEAFKKGITTIGKWGAALTGAAVAGASALVKMATDSAATADNIDKMSQKIGISRQAYQELDFICSQSGTSVDNLQMGMKTLVTVMDTTRNGTSKTATALEELGISATDANGNLRDSEEVMWEAMSALQAMTNESEKAKLATELFGRSGTELMPLLNGAEGSIEAMKEQAHELGLVIGDDSVDAGVKLTDTMDQMKRAFSTIATELGAKVFPMVQKVCEAIIGYLPMIQTVIDRLAPAFENLLSSVLPILLELASELFPMLVDIVNELIPLLVEVAGQLLPVFKDVIAELMPIVKMLLPLLMKIVKSVLPVVVRLIQIILPIITELLSVIIPIIAEILEPILELLEPIMEILEPILLLIGALLIPLAKLIGAILKPLSNVLTTLIGILLGKARPIIEWLAEFLGKVLVPVIEGLTYFIENFGSICVSAWEKVKSAFAAGVEAIKEFFEPMVNWFTELWQKIVTGFHTVVDPWIEIVKRAFAKVQEFLEPIIENIKGKFVAAVAKIKEVFAPVADFFKGVWSNIKSAFGSVADWFKDVFTKAWQNVKDVFSKGGQVFSGIKEGIEKTFKTVVNKLISGINTIIKKPFEKLNEMITKLKGINILGVSPFTWMKNFDVPQIPQLEKGGILKKGQIGLLEGKGTEAVIPLDRTEWVDKIANRLIESTSGNGNSRDVVNKLNELIELMKALKIYLYGDVLVGELAPAMDAALGTIYTSKGRGN